MLLKIKLVVATGEFVAEAFIIPSITLPEVVCWGQRFFKLNENDGSRTGSTDELPVYAEIMIGWCLPENYGTEPSES